MKHLLLILFLCVSVDSVLDRKISINIEIDDDKGRAASFFTQFVGRLISNFPSFRVKLLDLKHLMEKFLKRF